MVGSADGFGCVAIAWRWVTASKTREAVQHIPALCAGTRTRTSSRSRGNDRFWLLTGTVPYSVDHAPKIAGCDGR